MYALSAQVVVTDAPVLLTAETTDADTGEAGVIATSLAPA
jgi:hypothetical protein